MAKNAKYRKLIDSQFDDLPEVLRNEKLAQWLTSEHNIDRIEQDFKRRTKSYSKMILLFIICDMAFLIVSNNPDMKFTLFGWNLFKFQGINEVLLAISTFAFFDFVLELISAMSLTRLASELTNKAFNDVNPFYVHASLGRTQWLESVFSGHSPCRRSMTFRAIYKIAMCSASLIFALILVLHSYAIFLMSGDIVSSPIFDSTIVFLILASASMINCTAFILLVSGLVVNFKSP